MSAKKTVSASGYDGQVTIGDKVDFVNGNIAVVQNADGTASFTVSGYCTDTAQATNLVTYVNSIQIATAIQN